MAKTAHSELSLPEAGFPKLDLDTLFTLIRGNLAAMREAQDVLVDAAQAVARAQHGWLESAFASARSALTGKAPEAALADARGTVEKAVAIAREGAEVGAVAQRRVVDLLTQRAAANLEQLKTLVAA